MLPIICPVQFQFIIWLSSHTFLTLRPVHIAQASQRKRTTEGVRQFISQPGKLHWAAAGAGVTVQLLFLVLVLWPLLYCSGRMVLAVGDLMTLETKSEKTFGKPQGLRSKKRADVWIYLWAEDGSSVTNSPEWQTAWCLLLAPEERSLSDKWKQSCLVIHLQGKASRILHKHPSPQALKFLT